MSSPIVQAIRQICEEKNLAYEAVIDAIQSALAAAYRKDFGNKDQNIEALFDPETGSVQVWDVKTVVADIAPEELKRVEEERKQRAEALANRLDEAREKGEEIGAISVEDELGPRFNPKNEIMFSDARILKHDAALGDILRIELPAAGEFGRMAAMTAKQVITQKLREAEREVLFNEFKGHEGELLNATVQRREGRIVLMDLGRITGVLRGEDQNPMERYHSGDRMKVYVRQVSLTTKGPEILVSRTTDLLVKKLFEVEIPEVSEGLVEIKTIAREAGSRSKVAVATGDDGIDPIGACIGQRGTRIQTIISELGGEKVDIIEWTENAVQFISNALAPAKVSEVRLDEASHMAFVTVAPEQLSLAIGKMGQNVRLASRLTGWKLNITDGSSSATALAEADASVAASTDVDQPQAETKTDEALEVSSENIKTASEQNSSNT